jgi:hypothetical protein
MAAEAPNKPYVTLLTIVAGFLFIGIIADALWPTWVALAVAVVGLTSHRLASIIHKGWMGLAHLLGLIVPNILLATVFYLILFPMALLSRVFGQKDPLHLKPGAPTLFKTYNKAYTAADLEKPW